MRSDPKVSPPGWLNAYSVSQTWDEHIANAGPTLGGTDWAMGTGTDLLAPPGGGVIEQVTSSTRPRPSWYNTGLGYATAIRRSDGTRTVYAHNHAFVGTNGRTVNSGEHIAESGGAKGDPGAGTSTGAHVHIHDVLADGRTRRPAFSTISETAGGGTQPFSEGATMFGFLYTPSGTWKFLVVPGLYIKNTPDDQAEAALSLAGQSLGAVGDLGTLNKILWDAGFEDQFGSGTLPKDGWSLLQTLGGGKTLYTTAWKNAQAGATITDAQLDTLADKLLASLAIPSAADTASAVDRVLKDDFSAVPGAVAVEMSKRLQS